MNSTSFPILIIGLGAQAKAWALNLRDSGFTPVIGLRASSANFLLCRELKLPCQGLEKVKFEDYSIILNLTPDEAHLNVLEKYASAFKPGTSIFYAHGFSLMKHEIHKSYPQFNHILLAPKSIASELRFKYETKSEIAAAISLEGCADHTTSKNHLDFVLKNIGISKTVNCSIEQETLADLFSEQSLLCSVLPYCALKSFNKLVEKGIPKKLAYLECWVEMKLIVDTLIKLGPEKFFALISPNALIGGEKGRRLLLNEDYNKHLDELLDDVWSKKFFNEVEESDYGVLQENLVSFWKNQELTKIHQGWGKGL